MHHHTFCVGSLFVVLLPIITLVPPFSPNEVAFSLFIQR